MVNINTSKLDEIFWDASHLNSREDRAAYLDRVCCDDRVLRRRIEKLLSLECKAEHFLERSLDPRLILDAPSQRVAERPGATIGFYTLVRQIGEGGMGVVYLADQHQPVRRQVALKIIKPGLDTRSVVARFEVERQTLAMMDHPHVARVFDAGETEYGRPYFVMELVDGVPITAYCDQHRLSLDQRLRLFAQICQAVHHSHQKGIIHRDIKPTNILVTQQDGVAVPKIIDFGVAKATHQTSSDSYTTTFNGQLIGTPLYMSPEQAESSHRSVDTRSDIYSLGVVLYELLTGVLPFTPDHSFGIEEVRRILREEEPTRPSARIASLGQSAFACCLHRQSDPIQLQKILARELDWIVLKSLEKQPDRRYESANAFAVDITRYLADESVEACPPTLGYRLRKAIRKHRLAVTTSIVISAAILLGSGIAAWQAIVAQNARKSAEVAQQRSEEAEQRAVTEASVANAIRLFLEVDLLRQVHSDTARGDDSFRNPDLTVRQALDRASESIAKRFGNQPLVESGIRLAIGESYASLGEYQAGRPHLERAAEIRTIELGRSHPETLMALRALANTYIWIGRVPDATPLFLEIAERQKAELGADHQVVLSALNELANAYWMNGQFNEALRWYQYTFTTSQERLGADHLITLRALEGVGTTYRDMGRFDEAIEILETVIVESERQSGANHIGTIQNVHRLALAYQKDNQWDDADRLLRQSIERIRTSDVHASACLANLQAHLGLNLIMQGEYADAEPFLRASIAFYEIEMPDNWRHFHGLSLLGGSLLGQQQWTAAELYLVDGYQGMLDREPFIFAADRIRLAQSADRLAQFHQITTETEAE